MQEQEQKTRPTKDGSLTIEQLKEESITPNFYKVVSDLKAGLQRDFTIREACVYAGISHDTYYNWIKASDEFAAEMEKAQQFMAEKAKSVLMTALEKGDRDAAKWWLERRRKENYSTRTESKLEHVGLAAVLAEIDGKTKTPDNLE